jgi:hypothetical protein
MGKNSLSHDTTIMGKKRDQTFLTHDSGIVDQTFLTYDSGILAQTFLTVDLLFVRIQS